MTRRRWIADEVSGNHAALTGDHAHHLAKVLRAEVGKQFDISTGADVRRGRIVKIQPDRVEFELAEIVADRGALDITIALSIFKFDRMEWAIEKCTELGIVELIPVISARTEPHLAAAANKRVERWRRIAHQASEQSRRASAPEIVHPRTFKDLVSMQAELKIVLSELERKTMLRDVIDDTSNSVLLAFGPEGGWKEQEISTLLAHGWKSASLGKTILRAETAAIAAVAITTSALTK